MKQVEMAKRKVGIVTLHRVLNFGSVLQAYSTCVVLKRLGLRAEVIDYMEWRYTIPGAITEILRGVFSGCRWQDSIPRIARFILKVVSFAIQYSNFRKFVTTHIPVSKARYTAFSAMVRKPPEADVYMTGSDQVWNSDYNGGIDRAHYLDFAPDGKPRISYAASFGKTELNAEEVDETRELLGKYSAISLRELSGVRMLEDIGISGARHVLDPTMLLSREEWARAFSLVKPRESRYVLIYSVERSLDNVVCSTATKIGSSMGIPVIFLSQAARLPTMKACDHQRSFSAVVEFLRYMYFAEFVVASSFHGTAFAINFNRQFVSVLPPRFGSRPRSLLDLVGLNDRVVEKDKDMEEIERPIDYLAVNRILDRERKRSLDFLRTSLATAVVANAS